MAAELIEDRDIALQLHGVLSDIDPARWRDDMAAALKARLKDIQAWLEARERHAALARTLKSELPILDGADDVKARWLAFKLRVQPDYQALATRLKAARIHVPSLRPTNYTRNAFHITSAVVAVVAIEWLSNPMLILTVAVAWAAFAWTCEVSRRVSPRVNALLMRLFAPVAHPHEAVRVNSSTWYATALVLLALTQSTVLCVVGVAVLGFGDPVAALVGRRFGRTKLLHGRSLEGTLAFVAAALLATFALLRVFHPGFSLGVALALAASAAVLGAVAELLSLRVDDNLSIPVSAAAGVLLTATALGLTL